MVLRLRLCKYVLRLILLVSICSKAAVPAPSPAPDSRDWCANGIRATIKDRNYVCCDSSCGRCGGSGCTGLPGGPMRCCTSNVMSSQPTCKSVEDVACNIPRGHNEPAAGGTCGDPDPAAGGLTDYICPSGYFRKKPSVPNGECTNVSACNANCCEGCRSGEFLDGERCRPCEPGRFSYAGSDKCRDCEAGRFAPSAGQSSCDKCDNGTYVSPDGVSCTPCEAGKVSTQATLSISSRGSEVCSRCESGRVPNAGQSSCDKCDNGTYVSADGALCTPCEAGRVSTQAALSNSSRGSEVCSRCEAGRVPNAVQSSCDKCERGEYSASPTMKCTSCEPGQFSLSGAPMCSQCSTGKFSDTRGATSCDVCNTLYEEVTLKKDACIFRWQAIFACLVATFFLSVTGSSIVTNFQVCKLGKRMIAISGRLKAVEDIWTADGRVLLKTVARNHEFANRRQGFFPIVLKGTGHPFLECHEFHARVKDEQILELLHKNGTAVSEICEASAGFVGLSFWCSLVHCGRVVPLFAQVLVPVTFTLGLFYGFGVILDEIFPVLIIASLWSFVKFCMHVKQPMHSELQRSINKFLNDLNIETPIPVATAPGPYRAIHLKKLKNLHQQFAVFIRQRNMYYIEPNLVRPITIKWKLSLADVLGGSCVQWFVSHWWGSVFVQTMQALQNHSDAISFGEEREAYWICTFSNNQWKLDEEIPGKLEESSFFKTLLSGFCKGVCLILDELATPLKRSWCLFEYLHAVELKESDRFDNFEGLLFCHSSGVLNYGRATAEISLTLGFCLGNLRLQDATASRSEDKEMIDALVVAKLGSFERIDSILRHDISSAVGVAHEKTDDKFKRLRTSLDMGNTQNSSPDNNTARLSL